MNPTRVGTVLFNGAKKPYQLLTTMANAVKVPASARKAAQANGNSQQVLAFGLYTIVAATFTDSKDTKHVLPAISGQDWVEGQDGPEVGKATYKDARPELTEAWANGVRPFVYVIKDKNGSEVKLSARSLERALVSEPEAATALLKDGELEFPGDGFRIGATPSGRYNGRDVVDVYLSEAGKKALEEKYTLAKVAEARMALEGARA